jgi:hypothetical protein
MKPIMFYSVCKKEYFSFSYCGPYTLMVKLVASEPIGLNCDVKLLTIENNFSKMTVA